MIEIFFLVFISIISCQAVALEEDSPTVKALLNLNDKRYYTLEGHKGKHVYFYTYLTLVEGSDEKQVINLRGCFTRMNSTPDDSSGTYNCEKYDSGLHFYSSSKIKRDLEYKFHIEKNQKEDEIYKWYVLVHAVCDGLQSEPPIPCVTNSVEFSVEYKLKSMSDKNYMVLAICLATILPVAFLCCIFTVLGILVFILLFPQIRKKYDGNFF